MFTEALQQASHEFGLELTAAQMTAFNRYYTLLIEWNEKINLTAITDPKEVAVKHIIDSLSCLQADFFPENCSLIDVGTGAGFPGLPLKIVRPDIQVTLLDSLNKRVNFLKEVAESLALADVRVIHGRAEEAARAKEHRERYHLATARAVARLNVLCELCLPFVTMGGYFIAMKGTQFQEEITEAQRAMSILGAEVSKVASVKLPSLEDTRAVIYLKKNKAIPDLYPRRPGIPEKKPL
jgi:16S rRNA (guanine527-N7)-methyltransferase